MILTAVGAESISKLVYMSHVGLSRDGASNWGHVIHMFPYFTFIFKVCTYNIICFKNMFILWERPKPKLRYQNFFLQILFWSFFSLMFVLLNCCVSYPSNNADRNDCNDEEPWYRSGFFWLFGIFIFIILILGLPSDAMSIGDEGSRFLTWNKNEIVGPQLTMFSYSLTSSFSPNYMVHYQWDETSDVDDINIDANRVFNLTQVDVFLIKHNCGLGERMSSVFGSIPWGSPSHTVAINCQHNNSQ